MRKKHYHFTRLPNLPGRFGVMATALFGSLHIFGGYAFSQSPKHLGIGTQKSHNPNEGTSSREAREAAIQRIPFQQLTPEAISRLKGVIENASYFRRMPTEVVDCDQEMYSFLVRHPEVIVNIWDVMGVTKVTVQRTGPFQLRGNDGSGTSCNMDLVFGNDSLHIYYASGHYQGSLWPRELNGKCIVLLHNRPTPLHNGRTGMITSMDVFMKLDNVGADLVVKTLGPLVGKTADYNFLECASFLSQVSLTAEQNPQGIQSLAKRLNNIDPKVRDQFLATANSLSQRQSGQLSTTPNMTSSLAAKPTSDSIPDFKVGPRVPSPELAPSSRRRVESVEEVEEDRVDSPTILLIGKDEKNKSEK